jgi:hypothetical protein
MRPGHGLIAGALAAIAAGVFLAPHEARGDLKAGSLAQCFHGSDISAWRASDTKTIYLRVFASRIYRVDLSRQCRALQWPDAHLITQGHGPDLICKPIDFDIRASEGPGAIAEPCFVKSLTALTPDEVSALPRNIRP